MKHKYPQDLVIPGLVRKLGGEVWLPLPELTADERGKLLNFLSVPGLKVKDHPLFVVLSLDPTTEKT